MLDDAADPFSERNGRRCPADIRTEPGDERLTIYSSNQTPSFVRIEIARLFGWPENRVRVKVPYLGGGYGAKVYVKLEALVAALG